MVGTRVTDSMFVVFVTRCHAEVYFVLRCKRTFRSMLWLAMLDPALTL